MPDIDYDILFLMQHASQKLSYLHLVDVAISIPGDGKKTEVKWKLFSSHFTFRSFSGFVSLHLFDIYILGAYGTESDIWTTKAQFFIQSQFLQGHCWRTGRMWLYVHGEAGKE